MKCLAAAAVFMALVVAAQAAFDERGFNRDLMAHPSHPSNWESGEHGHKVLFRRGHVDTRETPSLRARLAAEPRTPAATVWLSLRFLPGCGCRSRLRSARVRACKSCERHLSSLCSVVTMATAAARPRPAPASGA